MKDTRERQILEEALRDERAGSAKIRAFADHVMLKDAEWRIDHRPAKMQEVAVLRLEMQKFSIEKIIEFHEFDQDADLYQNGFETAELIFPWYTKSEKKYSNPYRELLNDLREINREKSRK